MTIDELESEMDRLTQFVFDLGTERDDRYYVGHAQLAVLRVQRDALDDLYEVMAEQTARLFGATTLANVDLLRGIFTAPDAVFDMIERDIDAWNSRVSDYAHGFAMADQPEE